ncbi:adenosinetriphosphatase [Puccinia sorghi]|uniref:Adenosinetriphosphatase n=1 Tax=Puccinia sorghi TaxID=27349 RepID=A0A0L6U878_9BASI|nr:adenosinetriphosphatase [Puccinia sorghi]
MRTLSNLIQHRSTNILPLPHALLPVHLIFKLHTKPSVGCHHHKLIWRAKRALHMAMASHPHYYALLPKLLKWLSKPQTLTRRVTTLHHPLRLKPRHLPAWGHDLPYDTQPCQHLPDQRDMWLPLRERVVANPRVLATKSWDAIEEGQRQIWLSIAHKDLPRVSKTQQAASLSRTLYSKRLSALVGREAHSIIARTKASKEVQIIARRIMQEVCV